MATMPNIQNPLDSSSSETTLDGRQQLSGWVKVSVIAAASALAGGLAAAWIYRKTLIRLQKAAVEPENPIFRIQEQRTEDDA